MDIKRGEGYVLQSVPITAEAVKIEELMKQDSITLSWRSVVNEIIHLGAYVEYEGERYTLLAPYSPSQISEIEYEYKPVFHSRIMRWQSIPFFHYNKVDGNIVSKEPDWTLTDNPANFMAVICDAISNETGEEWTYSIADNLPASTSLSFSNVDIFSALNSIANAFNTEWWVDKVNNVLHLSKASFGDPAILEVGDNIKVPSVTNSKNGYYTRFYAFGSTRNIAQDYQGANVNNQTNRRLTLDPVKYPNGYKDIRENLTDEEVLSKVLFFDEVYPKSDLVISDVRVRLMWRLDNDSNKVQVGTDDNGDPVYDQYAIWYFKIPDYAFDESSIIAGKALSVKFKSGALSGREFELTYHSEEKKVSTSDGTDFIVNEGDYEINFIEDGSYIIPAITGLIPNDGDEITLFNIVMPEEYKQSAYNELEEELDKEIAKMQSDLNNYSFDSNNVAFYNSNPNLSIGRSVTYKNGSYSYSTRVIKLETKIDYPFEQKITIGNEQIKGNTQELKEEVVNANQNIDLLASINEMTNSITQAYQRTQKSILDSISKYNDMFGVDSDGNVYVKPLPDGTPRNFYTFGTMSFGGIDDGESGEGGGTGITSLYDIPEISISATLADGQSLVYDATLDKWVNRLVQGGSGVDMDYVWAALAAETTEKINASHIPDLSDVYLPLTGGYMHGSIMFDTGAGIKASNNSSSIQIGMYQNNGIFLQGPRLLYSPASGSDYKIWHEGNLPDTTWVKNSGGIKATDTYLHHAGYGYNADGWGTTGPAIAFGASNGYTMLMQQSASSYALHVSFKTPDGTIRDWKTIAFTDEPSFAKYIGSFNGDANTISDGFIGGKLSGAANFPYNYYSFISAGYDNYKLQFNGYNNNLQFRCGSESGLDNKEWRTVAFTDSNITGNAASATKLQTARKIWGNSFDGTGDIEGNINLKNNRSIRSWVADGSTDYDLLYLSGGNNFQIGYGTAITGKFKTNLHGYGIDFRARGTEGATMSLTTNGYVGIGITNPAYKLDVNGTTRLDGKVTLTKDVVLNNYTAIKFKDYDGTTELNTIMVGTDNAVTIGVDHAVKNYETRIKGVGVTLFHGNTQVLSLTSTELITAKGITPFVGNTYDLGTASNRWQDIYCYNLDAATRIIMQVPGFTYPCAKIIRDTSTNKVYYQAGLVDGSARQGKMGISGIDATKLASLDINSTLTTISDKLVVGASAEFYTDCLLQVKGAIGTNSYISFGYYGKQLTEDPTSAFRTTMFGDAIADARLRTFRANEAFGLVAAKYGAGLAWSTADTHAYINVDHMSSEIVYIGGGNADKLNWQARLYTSKMSLIPDSTTASYSIGDADHRWGGAYIRLLSTNTIGFYRNSANYIWATEAGGYFLFGVKDKGDMNIQNASLVIKATDIRPGHRNAEVDLGTSTYRWNTIYGASLNLSGNISSGNILPIETNTYTLGSTTLYWANLYTHGISSSPTGGNLLNWYGEGRFWNLMPQTTEAHDLGGENKRWASAHIKDVVAYNSVKIGEATLVWDAVNQCLVVDKNFVSDGSISFGGLEPPTEDNYLATNGGTILGDLGIGNAANTSKNLNMYGSMYFYLNSNPTAYKMQLWMDGNSRLALRNPTDHAATKFYVYGDIIYNGTCGKPSDMRLKHVIEDVCLSSETIANAPLFRYKRKDSKDDKVYIGSSAQYWQKVAPELTPLVDDYLTLDYATLGVMMGKSNATEIELLKERMKILEAKVENYERILGII